MIASFARPLMIAASVGWAACIIVSVLAFVGVSIPESAPGVLFFGAFPIWLCTVLSLQRHANGFPGWSFVFRGCPEWVRYAIWATFGYGALSVFLSGDEPFQAKGVGFIAVFYAASLGVFMTLWVTRDEPTECANGHSIGASDRFCRECGSEIKRSNSVPLVS